MKKHPKLSVKLAENGCDLAQSVKLGVYLEYLLVFWELCSMAMFDGDSSLFTTKNFFLMPNIEPEVGSGQRPIILPGL